MTRSIAQIVKRGLRTLGYYRRALSKMTFPGVAVLCYHGVRADDEVPGALSLSSLHMPAATFDSHCRVIRECCDPISLDDWRAASAGGTPLPKRPVLVTFDDGYRSVLTRGVPIAATYGVPVAVFVCTFPIQTRRLLWFDHIAGRDGSDAVEGWKDKPYHTWASACAHTPHIGDDDPRALMSSSELRALSAMKGVEIGGHTARHPILANATIADQRDEITENIRDIERWTGKRVRAFAYPNGRPGIDYNRDTLRVVCDAGIDMAFTTHPAFAGPEEPALERSRFLLLDDTSGAELAHRLAYSWRR